MIWFLTSQNRLPGKLKKIVESLRFRAQKYNLSVVLSSPS